MKIPSCAEKLPHREGGQKNPRAPMDNMLMIQSKTWQPFKAEQSYSLLADVLGKKHVFTQPNILYS